MLENLKNLPINELRQMWAEAWKIEPHLRIGRTMLEKSLEFKNQENQRNLLSYSQQSKLDHLIQQYKQNPKNFDNKTGPLKPGTRLVRDYKGKTHSVLVKFDGFEYQDQIYSSLSKIANDITGKRWNGWIFFGLRKASVS